MEEKKSEWQPAIKAVDWDYLTKRVKESGMQLAKEIEKELEKRRKEKGSVGLDEFFKTPTWSASLSQSEIDFFQALTIVEEETGIEFIEENGRYKPKHYLELPTYEDGTHVYFGNEYIHGNEVFKLEYITYKDGDIYTVTGKSESCETRTTHVTNNNPLKKVTPIDRLLKDLKGIYPTINGLDKYIQVAYKIGFEEGRKK